MPPRKKATAPAGELATATASALTSTTTTTTTATRSTRASTRLKTAASATAASIRPVAASSSREDSQVSIDSVDSAPAPKAKKPATRKPAAPKKTTTVPPRAPPPPPRSLPPPKKSAARKTDEDSKQLPVVTQISSPPTEAESSTSNTKQKKPAKSAVTKKASNAKSVNKTEVAKVEMGPTTPRKRQREDDFVLSAKNAVLLDISPSKAKKVKTKEPASKKSRSLSAPFSETTCKKWFDNYADSEDPTVMSAVGAKDWISDLGVRPEGAVYFVLAYKLQSKAMFAITKEEFLQGMKKLSIDSNEKLLHKLPDILGTVSPSHSSPEFKEFYKFCFNYVKSGGPVGAKNIELDMAIEFLAMALDRSRFSTTYTPPIDAAEPTTVRSTTLSSTKADGDFPHLYAFVEFLKAKTPVKVMNRDQWESFVPFNKSVGWDLEGYSEDGAWPSLFDQYIEWKKELTPKADEAGAEAGDKVEVAK